MYGSGDLFDLDDLALLEVNRGRVDPRDCSELARQNAGERGAYRLDSRARANSGLQITSHESAVYIDTVRVP